MPKSKATHICIKDYKASVLHFDCFKGYKVRVNSIHHDGELQLNFIGSPIKRGFCSITTDEFHEYFQPINKANKVLYEK